MGPNAMLATATSASGSGTDGSAASPVENTGANSLRAALAVAASRASGSMSMPQTGEKPSLMPARATTPVP